MVKLSPHEESMVDIAEDLLMVDPDYYFQIGFNIDVLDPMENTQYANKFDMARMIFIRAYCRNKLGELSQEIARHYTSMYGGME